MKVFDFDNTIYDGESPVDFFLFCAHKKKELIAYIPLMIYSLLLYKAGLLSIEKLYSYANKISKIVVQNKDQAADLITEFWEQHEQNLKPQYLAMIEEQDVILSASPRILLNGIKDKINTDNIICTEFNIETGKIEFSCFRENKVKAFLERYPNTIIDDLYIDSKNDKPLMKIAKRTHIVKK